MLKEKKEHKILVVDDSRFNRAVVTSMLEKNYFLEEACNGKEAVLILEDHAEEFSLVLTDLVMPDMDRFRPAQSYEGAGLAGLSACHHDLLRLYRR